MESETVFWLVTTGPTFLAATLLLLLMWRQKRDRAKKRRYDEENKITIIHRGGVPPWAKEPPSLSDK